MVELVLIGCVKRGTEKDIPRRIQREISWDSVPQKGDFLLPSKQSVLLHVVDRVIHRLDYGRIALFFDIEQPLARGLLKEKDSGWEAVKE